MVNEILTRPALHPSPRPHRYGWAMLFSPTPATPSRDIPAAIEKACLLLATFNALMIAVMYFGHSWLHDSAGRLIHTDYINVWAAGRLAIDGHPALAWD